MVASDQKHLNKMSNNVVRKKIEARLFQSTKHSFTSPAYVKACPH